MRSYEFCNFLDDIVTKWFNDIAVPADLDVVQAIFLGYFSFQGRSRKYLTELQFALFTNSIVIFINVVKKTVHQLHHSDVAI